MPPQIFGSPLRCWLPLYQLLFSPLKCWLHPSLPHQPPLPLQRPLRTQLLCTDFLSMLYSLCCWKKLGIDALPAATNDSLQRVTLASTLVPTSMQPALKSSSSRADSMMMTRPTPVTHKSRFVSRTHPSYNISIRDILDAKFYLPKMGS